MLAAASKVLDWRAPARCLDTARMGLRCAKHSALFPELRIHLWPMCPVQQACHLTEIEEHCCMYLCATPA